MKKWFKAIATVLTVVIMVQTVFGNYVYAKGDFVEILYSYEYEGTDGNMYTVDIIGESIENYTMTITNLKTQDKNITDYNAGVVTLKEYKYKGKNWSGKKKYSERNKKVVDMREFIKEVENTEVTGQGYGKTVRMIAYQYKAKDGKKYEYTYKVGNGADSGYTKIACCYEYKIKNSNTNLINYKNAIAESNAAFYESGLSVGTAMAATALMWGAIFTGGATFAVAALILSSLGLSTDSIAHYIDSYKWGEKADVYFDAAKVDAV